MCLLQRMKYKPWMQFCPRWCCIDDHLPPIGEQSAALLLSIMMAKNNKTTQRCDYHTATAGFGVMDLYLFKCFDSGRCGTSWFHFFMIVGGMVAGSGRKKKLTRQFLSRLACR
jgi:hypothetical protein